MPILHVTVPADFNRSPRIPIRAPPRYVPAPAPWLRLTAPPGIENVPTLSERDRYNWAHERTPEPCWKSTAAFRDDSAGRTTRDTWSVSQRSEQTRADWYESNRWDRDEKGYFETDRWDRGERWDTREAERWDRDLEGLDTRDPEHDDRRGWDAHDEEDEKSAAPFPDLALDDEDMAYVFKNIICKPTFDTEAGGVTIMLRDVPYRYQVEPNLISMIMQLSSIDHVTYIYLPISGPDRGADREPRMQSRNKGYGFIHFSTEEASTKFMKNIESYEVPETRGKKMYGALAKFQGVASNIHNVLDVRSKTWRPKHGLASAYVRTHTGLKCISLMVLRNLAKHYVKWMKLTGAHRRAEL